MTLNEKFGLKNGRSNFTLNPITDNAFFFGDGEEKDFITTTLRRAEKQAKPPRFVLWGGYGAGKTHRCGWIQHHIVAEGLSLLPVYTKISNIDPKTHVDRGQECLLKGMNPELVRKWVKDYLLRRDVGEDLPDFSELCPRSRDVVKAFEALGSKDDVVARAAWRFLSGSDLEKDDVTMLRLMNSKIEDTEDFASVFHLMGHLSRAEEGKTLLFMVDEAENVGRISEQLQDTEWREWLRGILDLPNIAIVMTVGAEKQSGMPSVIQAADIIRRIGPERYREVANMSEGNVATFLRELLQNLIEDKHRMTMAAKTEVSGHPDGFDPVLYPITRKGFEEFVKLMARDRRQSKPSYLLQHLDDIACDLPDSEDLITAAAVEAYERNPRS